MGDAILCPFGAHTSHVCSTVRHGPALPTIHLEAALGDLGAHALAGDGRPHSSTITVVCCFCWARSEGPAVCVRAGCAATATTYAQIKMLVDTNHRREALALNDLRAKRRRPRVGGRQAMTLIVVRTALRQSTQNFPKISRNSPLSSWPSKSRRNQNFGETFARFGCQNRRNTKRNLGGSGAKLWPKASPPWG